MYKEPSELNFLFWITNDSPNKIISMHLSVIVIITFIVVLRRHYNKEIKGTVEIFLTKISKKKK